MVSSALIGSPAKDDNDFWIIVGMYRAAYDYSANATAGYTLMPSRPEGYKYNDKRAGIVVGMVVCMVIMLFVTITRLSLRYFKAKLRLGPDDYVLLPAAMLALSYPILQIAMVTQGGAGKHVWDVTYEEYNIFNAYGVYCKMIFFIDVGLIKISICLFIRRLSGIASKAWRIANDVLLFILTGYILLALFWTVFQCNPPRAMWDKAFSGRLQTPAKCWSTELLATVLSTLHVVTDFILLTAPMFILWSVKMSRAKKIRLFIVFGVGALSCLASVFRQIAQKNIDMDITYGYTTLLAWTLGDLTLATVVVSLPVLSALLPKALKGMSSASRAHDTWQPAGTYTSAFSTSRSSKIMRSTATRASSDEGGILREDEVELSYVMYKSDELEKGLAEHEQEDADAAGNRDRRDSHMQRAVLR